MSFKWWISHDKWQGYLDLISEGVLELAKQIAADFPPLAIYAIIYASSLVISETAWNLPAYDHGSGIGIDYMALTGIITGAWSQ